MKVLPAVGGLAVLLATFSLAASAVLADSSTGNSTQAPPTKLTWKPVRPSRDDAATTGDRQDDARQQARQKEKDAKDAAVQAAHYEVDVFGAEPAPRPPIQLTSGQGSLRGPKLAADDATANPFVDDLPSVKARRLAQRPTDAAEATAPAMLDPPANREAPPTLQVDSEAVTHDPVELNPANPMHIGVPHHTAQIFSQPGPSTTGPSSTAPSTTAPSSQTPTQNPPSTQSTPAGEPQLDLVPGADQTPSARPRMPEQDCHEEYERVKNYTLNKLSINILPPKDNPEGPTVPYECSLSKDPFTPRCWGLTTFTWTASALCHKPLYFEETAAERYGHSRGPYGLEYLTSFCHFFGNLALLPYWVGVDTPNECMYDLGYYRPGDCAPYEFDAFPLSVRGAVTGAAGYCGVIALFP